jgi:tetratricopeptide (TPR) repeat protein
MYYRPNEKKRNPVFTLFLSLLLIVLTGVLLFFISIYVGYVDIEPPALADRFKPTPTPTRPATSYVGDGDMFFAEGKIPQAIEAYEQAIQIDPTLDAPFIRQSRLLVYTRETAKAVERAAESVRLKPESAENMAYYCRALDWEARYAEAFDACSCATELDPTYAEGYAFLAEIYADQGNWVLSRTTAQQAIDTNYQSMDAHHNMGYAMETQGRYSEAAESYENAAKLAPQLGPLYVDIGRSYYWLGNYEQASDNFKRAIRLNPTDPEAYNWLGWTYYTDGDLTQAFDALEQSLSIDPTYISNNQRGTSAWGNLATVYYTRQNFEKTIELLPKAIELAESAFVRRVRQIEVYTQIDTFTGPETIPILEGHFVESNNRNTFIDSAQLKPIIYQLNRDVEAEQTCAAAIVREINNEAFLISSTQSLTETQAFSQASGTANLNLTSGMLSLDINDLPPTDSSGYEIKVVFWPNRTDSIGFIQPDNQGRVSVNFQFEEKATAPIEYYYTLGLAYTYMNPPLCDQAVPWLLKSLEFDSSGGNPAWAGLRICPSSNSPPTPIPTFTPIPEEIQ